MHVFRPKAAIFSSLNFAQRVLYICVYCEVMMAAIGRNMKLFFFAINTILNPYHHSCVFMTDICLTVSLSTHNGDDTPQKYFVSSRLHLPHGLGEVEPIASICHLYYINIMELSGNGRIRHN